METIATSQNEVFIVNVIDYNTRTHIFMKRFTDKASAFKIMRDIQKECSFDKHSKKENNFCLALSIYNKKKGTTEIEKDFYCLELSDYGKGYLEELQQELNTGFLCKIT